MFVAPSGEVLRDEVECARKRLQQMGFVVRVPDNFTRQRGYLSGTDDQRAAEFMRAFCDPTVDAVFCFRGGYGTTRILDRLDFKVIAANPKIVIGYSDITALHLALGEKANLVTFHSPNVNTGIGQPEGLNEFSAKYFWRNILAAKNTPSAGFTYEPPDDAPLKTLREGTACGRLTGGNLSLIAALMGTSYEIETAGRVLFIEDIHEAPYRVDRMLSQLRLAGKLASPAAVILGQFIEKDRASAPDSLTMEEVFLDYFGAAPYPVIANFPAGHHRWNATLPLNAEISVDATAQKVRVLQSPVITTK